MNRHQPQKVGLVGVGGETITSNKPAEPEKDLSKITWEPMPGKIVVKVLGERDTYGKGLIFRPASVHRPRTTGRVIAVYEAFIDYGDKDETKPFLEVGDIVVFGQHSGIEVEYGSDKVVVLREQEILTKVRIEKAEDIQHLGVAGGALDDVGDET